MKLIRFGLLNTEILKKIITGLKSCICSLEPSPIAPIFKSVSDNYLVTALPSFITLNMSLEKLF